MLPQALQVHGLATSRALCSFSESPTPVPSFSQKWTLTYGLEFKAILGDQEQDVRPRWPDVSAIPICNGGPLPKNGPCKVPRSSVPLPTSMPYSRNHRCLPLREYPSWFHVKNNLYNG